MRYFPEKQGKGQQRGINPNLANAWEVTSIACILLWPVFVHLRMSYPFKNWNLHLYQRFWYSLIRISSLYQITQKNEYTSFHQELYATNQYCWVIHFKSTILCQVFVHLKFNLLRPQHWPSLGAPNSNFYNKTSFYCITDTLFWGCTETCQCTKTCQSGIEVRSESTFEVSKQTVSWGEQMFGEKNISN